MLYLYSSSRTLTGAASSDAVTSRIFVQLTGIFPKCDRFLVTGKSDESDPNTTRGKRITPRRLVGRFLWALAPREDLEPSDYPAHFTPVAVRPSETRLRPAGGTHPLTGLQSSRAVLHPRARCSLDGKRSSVAARRRGGGHDGTAGQQGLTTPFGRSSGGTRRSPPSSRGGRDDILNKSLNAASKPLTSDETAPNGPQSEQKAADIHIQPVKMDTE